MNIKELRESAITLNQQAHAILTDKASTEDKVVEAERMIDEADKLETRADNIEKTEAREKAYNELADRAPVEDTSFEARGVNVAENEARAFEGWLRSGDATELRAQSVGTLADGGYLVPTGFVPNLIETMKAYGPMNDGGPITYLTTASGNSLLFPTTNGTAVKGAKVAENAAASESAMVFGQKQLDAYKYTSGVILVSNELMQDSAIDLVGHITKTAGERLGRIINQELTIGDGVGDPEGIVVGATAGITTAAAAAISYDDLIGLEHSVDPAYWNTSGYQFNSDTLKLLRMLKDADGRPLWTPSMVVGAPNTINGKPYYLNQDMANVAATNVSVIYGDFSKYTARRVASVGIKRLDQAYAINDQTAFVAFVRVDGALMDTAAVKKLTQKT